MGEVVDSSVDMKTLARTVFDHMLGCRVDL